jgi:hypothetical protein
LDLRRAFRSRRQTASAGAEAAQTDTFAFGSLAANDTREMVWNVTAVQAGTYTVHYRVAAGLQGKAKAVTGDGSIPEGEFVVRISSAPPQTRVNDAGQVIGLPGDVIGQAGSQQQSLSSRAVAEHRQRPRRRRSSARLPLRRPCPRR